MQTKIPKARLEAKVNPEIYQLFKQAAAITGRTLTDFIVDVVYKESVKTIAEHQSIQLSVADQAHLLEHLDSYEINPAMEEALSMHQQFLARKNTRAD
ncbi:type II toxin-antitoxin system TacA family antitoxin [Avibacterium paragallinarum]|uniref:DUF1778 domain-containing protein n=1 Tax=Avibacterium paragallinarum TaxID=728 RepID=A0A0F5ET63_AVIPA|nr:DUF1778 domain-containing protein [Avibacterium paragallinarum]AZI14235.1 DUF1778 domain-containing protein [Avibacterium paragallinarum]KAA6208317.1 DUF1778 domain-containing protein [Avibacterium paragallinarum]KKB01617.1 hypothetical protein Z012_05450 [Avibacterium paragallinarum]QIR11707.1 DUF1778 domain-containing protein [Avibacterium paragallinarum]QJE09318.1 DUF1778 domain-containing protein [Avibacterium paragallinarum]